MIYLTDGFTYKCKLLIAIQNSKQPKTNFSALYISETVKLLALNHILLQLSPMIQQSSQTIFQQQDCGRNEK